MVQTLLNNLTMRPPTMADLEIVYELVHTCDLAWYGEEDHSLDDIRSFWTAPDFDLARDERLVFDPAGQLIASLSLDQQEHAKFYVNVCVRPGYGDQSIGTYLLELAEIWARERLLKARPETRVTLNGWLESIDQEGQQRYERANFKEIRRYWRMETELSAAPALADWPEGVTLRPFVVGRDEHAVHAMIETTFQDHWGHLPEHFADWKHWTVERPNFDPSLWFVAYADEQIAGCSLCNDFNNYGQLGWVDTLGVARAWRRKGLGLALLLHSFGEFYRRGWRRAGLGVDSQNVTGATRLYRRAGMYKARESLSYEKELRPGVELSPRMLAI